MESEAEEKTEGRFETAAWAGQAADKVFGFVGKTRRLSWNIPTSAQGTNLWKVSCAVWLCVVCFEVRHTVPLCGLRCTC